MGNLKLRRDLEHCFEKLVFPSVAFTPIYYKGPAGKNAKMGKEPEMPKWFIPFVVEQAEEIKKNFCNDGIIHILDVGKYRDYKNHFFLVDAFANLPQPEKYRVTIIGQLSNEKEEYYTRLKEYVKEKRLDAYFDIKGHVPFCEMDKIYLENDILILPSKDEVAGGVVLEAMAKVLCVMCSNNCGIASYLEKYKCGMVFKLEDTNELSEYLQIAANDVNFISKFGKKAHEVTTREFGLKTI